MISAMSAPQKRPVGRPRAKEPKEVGLSTRGTQAHQDALEELASRTRGRYVSTEILIAIEDHLQRNGLWPPKPRKPVK